MCSTAVFPFSPIDGEANKIYMGKNVKIGKGALLKGPAIIEDGCVIGEGARILPYAVLGKKCVLGKNSSVSRSVLWDSVTLGDHVQLDEVVLGRNCKVQDYTKIANGSVLGDNARL
jgi:NDP-sugar pyrophosphorylase family protein